MKFSFTSFGQLKKILLNLNDQRVFDGEWNVNEIKDVLVISFNLDLPGRPVGQDSATSMLYQFLSNKRHKPGLMSLLGVLRMEYQMDKEKFDAFYSLCSRRIEKGYEYLTWIDVVMLLFILKYFQRDTDLFLWADSHVHALIKKNRQIVPLLKRLT